MSRLISPRPALVFRTVYTPRARSYAPVSAFAHMQAGPDLDAEPRHGFHDRLGTTQSPNWPVEGCEEAVSCGVHLLAPVTGEERPHARVMGVDQFPPSPIADLRGLLCRAHDVREKHRGENPVEIGLLIADISEKFRDGPCDRIGSPVPVVLIVPGELYEPRTKDVVSEVLTCSRRVHPRAVSILQDKRRHVD